MLALPTLPDGGRRNMTRPDELIESLRQKRDVIAHWLNTNFDDAGTPQHRRFLIVHRLLTDLIDLEGGTPEQREYVMRKLNET